MAAKFASLLLKVEDPVRVFLIRPDTFEDLKDAEGNRAYVDVYSADSPVAAKYRRDLQTERLKRGARAADDVDPDRDFAEFIAAITTGWRLVGFDGAVVDVPFSVESAKELYTTPGMRWLFDQVQSFANDRGNFLGASSSS